MEKSEHINELVTALAKAQAEFEPVFKDTENPAYRGSKYADLATILSATQPALNRNGLVLIQGVRSSLGETPTTEIETMLAHSSGQWISDSLLLPSMMRERFDAQTVGSAITYGRRYSAQSMLGVAADVDDDGNAASGIGSKQEQKKVVEAKVAAANGAQKTITLKEKKDGSFVLSGNGLDVVLLSIPETDLKAMGMVWDGFIWSLPNKSAFALEDCAKRQGVALKYEGSPAQQPQRSDGAAEVNPSRANPPAAPHDPALKMIESAKEKSGRTKAGKEWAMLEVHYGGDRFICWQKKLWPLIITNVGKLALLETVPSFDKKKDGEVVGIERIGSTEYEINPDGVPKAKRSFEFNEVENVDTRFR